MLFRRCSAKYFDVKLFFSFDSRCKRFFNVYLRNRKMTISTVNRWAWWLIDCEQSLFCSKIRGKNEERKITSANIPVCVRALMLFCVLRCVPPHGFSSKRETARSLGG